MEKSKEASVATNDTLRRKAGRSQVESLEGVLNMSKGKSQSLVLKVVVTESRTSKKAIKCGGDRKRKTRDGKASAQGSMSVLDAVCICKVSPLDRRSGQHLRWAMPKPCGEDSASATTHHQGQPGEEQSC